MTSKYLTRNLTGGLLALLCTLPAVAANLAGNAVFVSGKVTATDPAGDVRELSARDEIYSGDLLVTRRGRVQIKFIDGAFMSIQPDTRFQIEEYHFTNESDGSEKAVYKLFKGGMRAFTGAIGKTHPNAYKVKTPVATIGIRGTGHNTAHCDGDCTGPDGQPLPDGTHHSTWEGVTTVTNEAGTTEVPTGKSVYVQSIDSPAVKTNEPSSATAVQPSQDTVDELVEEQEEQVTLEAGEQVDSGGVPEGLPPPPPTGMVQNQTLQGILTNLTRDFMDPDNADGGRVLNNTVLVGPDSMDTAGMFAAVGMELDEDSDMGADEMLDLLITIDPDGVLAADMPDANITRGQEFITDALAGGGTDAALVISVIDDPATVAEHTEGSFLGTSYAHGRWTDGKVLFIDEVTSGPNTGERTVEVDDLGPDNHFHYLYGDAADTNFGMGATGTYSFISGNASTGTHDGFVGSGVQSGTLLFDFTTLNGILSDLVILHDTTYTVNGELKIELGSPGEFFDAGVTAATTGTGSTCENGCNTFIDGSFLGSLAGAGVNGAPGVAGLDYEIVTEPFDGETGNSIIGNAVFGRSGTATPIPDIFSVLSGQGLVSVAPSPTPVFPNDFVEVGLAFDTTAILGDDIDGTNGVVAAGGTFFEEVVSNPDEILFSAATIDPDGILGITDADPNLVAMQGLISDALISDNALVESVNTDPALIAEFFQGSGFAYGRWADGNVLFVDENIGGSGVLGEKTVVVGTFIGNQSLHFVYADTPATPASGATGTYDFVGGTQSTTFSGATIGQGVTSGQLTFDFDALSGTIAMTVNHLTDYNVTGALGIDGTDGTFTDLSVTAVTTSGGNCDSGCVTFIDGGFGGALSGGTQASPGFAGLEYDITDPVDGIMGVAAFNRTGDGPAPIP